MIEKTPRSFGIGQNIQPKRDLTRFIKWPAYVRLQRQKAVLKTKLKIPSTVKNFAKKTADKNTATSIFKLFAKYRPETKIQKKERLTNAAKSAAEGKQLDQGKKPMVLKYGINHITALIENKKPQLVIVAHDVDPIEIVIWIPTLCKKMGIPCVVVKSKARLGTLVHKKTATALALCDVKPEDKQELAAIVNAINAAQ